MRPITVTVSARTSAQGSAASNWIVLDRGANPFALSIGVTLSGVGSYTVQHTLDDVGFSVTPASARIFNHDDLVAFTSSDDGNYAFAVNAVRLMVNGASGASGNVEMTIIQAGG